MTQNNRPAPGLVVRSTSQRLEEQRHAEPTGPGLMLTSPQVSIVFWGAAWNNPGLTSLRRDIELALRSMLSSSYVTSLSEYNPNIGSGTIVKTDVFTGSPAPIDNFSDQNVIDACEKLLDDGSLVLSGDQHLFLFFAPPGVTVQRGNTSVLGEHWYYERGVQRVHFGWVTGNNISDYSCTASHEMVESITDPEMTGITFSNCPGVEGTCEIGDLCGTCYEMVDGTVVQDWYSVKAGVCTRPNEKQVFSDRGPTIVKHTRLTQALQATIEANFGMQDASNLTHVGSTPHFDVSYFTPLGQQGLALAQALLQTCERDYSTLQQIFGGITPHRLPFVVQITSSGAGASHSSCLGTDIGVGGAVDGGVDFVRSLLVAEADEVFMANFGRGWDCGASPGEGLSRVLANDIYKGVEPKNFISSNAWLNSNPRQNFVDYAKPTDTDYPSIGCSVLFLNWLRFQLNFSWSQIVASGGATLADTYKGLTGRVTAWKDFRAILGKYFPEGQQYDLPTDNPFPITSGKGQMNLIA